MKRLLFISRSGLCHNLLQEVLLLVPVKTELVPLEGFSQVEQLPESEKKFALVLVDQNCLEGDPEWKGDGIPMKHPSVKTAQTILIYPHNRKPDPRLTEKISFEAMGQKPFLPEELASLISKGLR